MNKLLLFFLLFLPFSLTAQQFDCQEVLIPTKDKTTRLWGYKDVLGEWKVEPVFTKTNHFVGNFGLVKDGYFYGYLDCEGTVRVSAKYDSLTPISFGGTWGRKDGKWGRYSTKGLTLVEPQFEELAFISSGSPLVWLRKEGQWQLYHQETKRTLHRGAYGVVAPISDSASILRSGAEFGVLLHNGNFSLPMGISEISPIAYSGFYFIMDGKYGLFNRLGRVIHQPMYDTLYRAGSWVIMKKGSSYGALSMEMAEMVEPIYDSITSPAEGVFRIKKDGTWGYVYRSGKIIYKPTFEEAMPPSKGLAIVKSSGRYGILDLRDKTFKIKPEFAGIYAAENKPFYATRRPSEKGYRLLAPDMMPFREELVADTFFLNDPFRAMRGKTNQGYFYVDLETGSYLAKDLGDAQEMINGFAVAQKEKKFGVLKASGEWLIEPSYDTIIANMTLRNPQFLVKREGRWGVMDKAGEDLFKLEFDELVVQEDRYYKAKKKGKWGALDHRGKVVISFVYDMLHLKKKNMDAPAFPAIFSKGNTMGLVNQLDNELISLKADTIVYLGGALYGYRLKSQWGIFDERGTLRQEPFAESLGQYDEASLRLPFKRKGKWGYVDQGGHEVISPQYEEGQPFLEGSAYVKKNGKWGAIDTMGNILIPIEYEAYKVMPNGRWRLYNPK